MNSAILYIRFLILGIAGIVLSFFLIRINLNSKDGAVATLLSLLAINFLCVAAYTSAVIRDPRRVSDLESPDLAYYLGFSLTIATLSITFIVDRLFQGASNTERLGSTILQFSAGLLATLFGLCAKIYLTSRQSNILTDAKQLRISAQAEFNELRRTIVGACEGIAITISRATDDMARGAEKANNNMKNFCETLERSKILLVETFSDEKLRSVLGSFIKNLQSVSEPIANARSKLESLSSQTDLASKSITGTAVAADTTAGALRNITESGSATVASLNRISEGAIGAATALHKVTDASTSVTQALGQEIQSLKSINDVYPQLNSALSNYRDQTIELLRVTETFDKAVASITREAAQFGEELQKMNSSMSGAILNVDRTSESYQTLNSSAAGLVSTQSTLNSALSQIKVALDSAAESATAAARAYKDTSEGADVANSAQKAFAQTITQWCQDLIRAALALTSLNKLLETIGSSLSSVTMGLDKIQIPASAVATQLDLFSRTVGTASGNTSGLMEQLEHLRATITELQRSINDSTSSIFSLAKESNQATTALRLISTTAESAIASVRALPPVT